MGSPSLIFKVLRCVKCFFYALWTVNFRMNVLESWWKLLMEPASRVLTQYAALPPWVKKKALQMMASFSLGLGRSLPRELRSSDRASSLMAGPAGLTSSWAGLLDVFSLAMDSSIASQADRVGSWNCCGSYTGWFWSGNGRFEVATRRTLLVVPSATSPFLANPPLSRRMTTKRWVSPWGMGVSNNFLGLRTCNPSRASGMVYVERVLPGWLFDASDFAERCPRLGALPSHLFGNEHRLPRLQASLSC